jgi:hypothetical protein
VVTHISEFCALGIARKFWKETLATLLVYHLLACTTHNKPITRPYFHEYPTAQKERVTEICDHVAASHFVVEKRLVYFRRAETKDDINMPYYNTELPDGYYFCSDLLLPKSHLE